MGLNNFDNNDLSTFAKRLCEKYKAKNLVISLGGQPLPSAIRVFSKYDDLPNTYMFYTISGDSVVLSKDTQWALLPINSELDFDISSRDADDYMVKVEAVIKSAYDKVYCSC